jgi:hypothetical protein
MRRSTGLHANQAGWQRFEELCHLRPTKLFSDRDVLGSVNAVDLEHVLRDIQTDRGNLHVDGSPHVIRLNEPLYGTSMPGAGAVHHIRPVDAIIPGLSVTGVELDQSV